MIGGSRTASIILLLGVLIAYVCAVFVLVLALRYRARLRAASALPPGGYAPAVLVVVPCSGLDVGFEANMLALLQQDYPAYQVIFVTGQAEDPAYPCLQRLVAGFPIRARLVLAGTASQCSQKVHNQLAALRAADSSDAEVLVFVDSDGRAEKQFLRHLVTPLGDPQVGMASGYRWYAPVHGRLIEQIAAFWGAIEAAVQAEPLFSQAWGGAMAIRRQLFEALDMPHVWATASTDDDALTRALNAQGLGIVFVPRGIVLTPVDYTLSEFMAWGTRQLLLMRVYLVPMWRQLFALITVVAFSPLAGLALTAAGLIARTPLIAPGVALLVVALGPMLAIALIARATERLAISVGLSPQVVPWGRLLAVPLGAILMWVHFLRSGLTRRVQWRGICYELQAPDRTIVRGKAHNG